MFGSAKRGGRLSRPEIHEDDFELCWVLEGRLEISLPGEIQSLSAGEALQFDAILEHGYRVIEDCRILILHIAKSRRF